MTHLYLQGLTTASQLLQFSYCYFKVYAGTRNLKVGISGYGNLQTMSMDKWATSKSTQLSTKIWIKLLLLENPLKLNFEAR